MAKGDNVFSASLVFFTQSFDLSLWYLGLLLLLGHPSMSLCFLGNACIGMPRLRPGSKLFLFAFSMFKNSTRLSKIIFY